MLPKIPVSTGELLDKITILEIKSERIDDQEKLTNISNELKALQNVANENEIYTPELEKMILKLKSINEKLWDIEDKIRIKESMRTFDDEFLSLARSVYITNDERADIKKKINHMTNSKLVEEKSYKS